MSKNIIICCDGTGNRSDAMEGGKPALSNVAKLVQALQDRAGSGWRQVVWYDDGVGTGTSTQSIAAAKLRGAIETVGAKLPTKPLAIFEQARMIYELATGAGITENIIQGYTRIVHHYEPGDRIFLFGFSRGAYTARCIAGVISRCGLLRAENIRLAPDVVQLYRYRDIADKEWRLDAQRPELFHKRAESLDPAKGVMISMLGVWDTVASLGLPLWGWWFRIGKLWSNESIDTSPVPICKRVAHAVSIDERRAQFFVTLFDEDKLKPDQIVEQRWFRGSHAGTGGGYVDAGLSDISLRWMMERAAAEGLSFRPGAFGKLAPQPLATVQSQLQSQKAWYLFGTWPRWHPCLRPGSAPDPAIDRYGTLDPTVGLRAQRALANRRERATVLGKELADLVVDAEEMLFLDPGQRARVAIRADRQWNRTGVVFETGATYLLQRADRGEWRDKDCKPCGPSGQIADERGGLRRRFEGQRRVPESRWMELIGTVAHPRAWPLKERSGNELLDFVFRHDPIELREQLMTLGRHIAEPEDWVVVRMTKDTPSGMFYAFANDLWLFYANNTGAIELDITRVDGMDAAQRERFGAPRLRRMAAEAAAHVSFVVGWQPATPVKPATEIAEIARGLDAGIAPANP